MPYSFQSRIRYSETDEKGFLSLGALIDYFQDCSTFQSEDVGLGISSLKERNLAWILSSWQIIIHRLPRLCDLVKVSTLPYAFKSFLGYRNFLLEDESGTAALANSVWVLFDMERKRPVRVDDEMVRRYGLEERLDMPYVSRKIQLPADLETAGSHKEAFFITRHHLDTNHHVNNGQYIRMAMEYLPDLPCDASKQLRGIPPISQVRAEYSMQARLGDEILPVCYEDNQARLQTEKGQEELSPDKRIFLVALENAEKKPFATVEFTLSQ